MRKLLRPHEPDAFTQGAGTFKAANPCTGLTPEGRRWNAFRNEQQAAYSAARELLCDNQQGLCAYCEICLEGTNQQIEHFVPKVLSSPPQDWTLEFSNLLLCCKGGTNKYSSRDEEYSTVPSANANQSCGEKKGGADPRGRLLNPYELPVRPIVTVDYRDEGLFFVPDEEACRQEKIDAILVENTLEALGLNCPRLVRSRKAVWKSLTEEIEMDVYSVKDIYALENVYGRSESELIDIAKNHLCPRNGCLQSYVTTRLLCLADDLPMPQLLEIAKG